MLHNCATQRSLPPSQRQRQQQQQRQHQQQVFVALGSVGAVVVVFKASRAQCDEAEEEFQEDRETKEKSFVRDALEAAVSSVRDAKYGCFVTVAEERGAMQPYPRLVEVQASPDLATAWIVSNLATRKVAQIQQQGRVAIFVWHPESMTEVTLFGRARVMSKPDAVKKWPGEDWKLFYPDGPEASLRYCCIEVEVDRLEIISVGHGIATGEDPKDWHPPAVLARRIPRSRNGRADSRDRGDGEEQSESSGSSERRPHWVVQVEIPSRLDALRGGG